MINTLMLLGLLGVASADAATLQVTLTATSDTDIIGDPLGHSLGYGAIFTTDGVCAPCSAIGGLGMDGFPNLTTDGILSFDIVTGGHIVGILGPGVGEELLGLVNYDPTTNAFSAITASNSNEVYDFFANGTYNINLDGDVNELGAFSVSPVPEPSAWLLLSTSVILFSFAARRAGYQKAAGRNTHL
jgi:hypothetical protein